MHKKLANFLFSTRLTSVLFIVFLAAMAIGTFLDRHQETSPTPYTRTLIYHAFWFKAIMLLFVVNFVGNIFRYRLFKKEKWATLIFHVAFILIIIGAAITHYFSFEGMMSIREGESENSFLSQKTYITTYIDGDYQVDGKAMRRVLESEVDLSERLNNDVVIHTDYNKAPIKIELENFITNAEEDIIPDENGEEYLKIVEAGNGVPHNHFLKIGEDQLIHNIIFTLNNPKTGAVNLTSKEGRLFIQSPFEGEYLQMASGQSGKLIKDSIQPFFLRSRYIIGGMQMVMPKPIVKGRFDIVKKSKLLKNDEDGMVLNVTANGETKKVKLLGGKGTNNAFKQIKVGGLDFAFRYGAKVLELPFSIKLNDFVADRYPGTEKSYSAFSSQVTVLDKESGDYDYKIFMNNILDHKGYRFFQSSFDPDEKGTILSVNHDFWGTWITYIGYFLLYIGLMAILFVKGSRFADLKKQLNKVKAKKAKYLTVLFLAISMSGFAQKHSEDDGHIHSQRPTKAQIDSILRANITPKEHVHEFSKTVIQDLSGRMMPINTYSSELLRKISKSDTYEEFNSDQVLLSMQESPLLWYNVPIIYLKYKKSDSIRKIIGLDKSVEYAALTDFFNERGTYKLAPYLEDAYKTTAPTAIEKEFKETDQRVNLLYSAIEGDAIKIFPIPNDPNNKWVSSIDYRKGSFKVEDTLYSNFIRSGFKGYLFTLNEAKKTNDFSKPEALLNSFKKTQQKYGSSVMISDDKIATELKYNKYDVFKNLHYGYMLVGFLMFVILIIQIFNYKSKTINVLINVFKYTIYIMFVLHTIGLVVRWYLSGHAPWSDAYESMIYVSWATMFFALSIGIPKQISWIKNIQLSNAIGSVFFRKASDLTVAAGAFVTSMILMVAHLNWMDPAIANLQPVLNSYWLMIHVAVIVASYGPFTLGMILGFVSLLLIILTNEKNKERMLINIKELTIITEMALTVGLIMLTIGNFLGGMWANESWGRYWGWDPKETWALISIMVYAFVLHMRLVPGLRGRFGFNLGAIIAYASILMTYFGVNFYLSGLHSYASGDQIISINYIAGTSLFVAILGFVSYRQYTKFYKK